jgi:hypothetical protein
VGTFNLSATILSKKDSSTMLPELTEFVPAIRMGIVRKVLLGLENRAGCSTCSYNTITILLIYKFQKINNIYPIQNDFNDILILINVGQK